MKFYVIFYKLNMSRIGKLLIKIPTDVKILHNSSKIKVIGKFGELSLTVPLILNVKKIEGFLVLSQNFINKTNFSELSGLYRSLINNMIQGVSEKFNLTLTLQGVGYRAIVEKNNLILNLGYSHSIKLVIPDDVTIEVFKNTTLKLSSCNKQKLGEIGAKIKSFRFPEPYKGKGIRYENEIIKQKIGKTAKSTKK